MDHRCQAIKANGRTCNARARIGGHVCKLHANMFVRYGEQEMLARAQRALADREARNRRTHARLYGEIDEVLQPRTGYVLGGINRNLTVRDTVREPFRTYFQELFPQINRLVDDIYLLDIRFGGHMRTFVEQIREELDALPRPDGELGRFAADAQNVHTTAAVKQTKDVIDRVLRIAVPDDYKSPNLSTMAEVLGGVKMSKPAAQQFAVKYCADEDIYDYGKGIYARVADAVWQFVKNSPDRTDLCKIMGVELTDSVGMCAQGNLTRLCNVLAGYLDGINTESLGEQLQRRMAALMVLDSDIDRLTQGKSVLQELAVPEAEWGAWLEALA
jgi:hypothetical protein